MAEIFGKKQMTGLPECKLIDSLKEKAQKKETSTFDYISHLESIWLRVGQELCYVVTLFPEYTPHDSVRHVAPLFVLASDIIGDEVIDDLNSTELFLLVTSIICHDWGMALSESAQKVIWEGKPIEESERATLGLLPDEQERFLKYCKREGFSPDDAGPISQANAHYLREYVRQTHSLRSAERVRQYFASIDRHVGSSIAIICEGHTVDRDDLRDTVKYDTEAVHLKEKVNLLALTLYLRLADVFDLGRDRTPLALWKFVSPTNIVSQQEWKRHDCLNAVFVEQSDHGGRMIVSGSTSDLDVYYSIKDLDDLCEAELKAARQLLRRTRSQSRIPIVADIDWKVQPQGFEPMDVRFDFDRDRMFQILSSEIYQGDNYVFLRELLQNSIDAIRMRKAVLLASRGTDRECEGIIRVLVQHFANGDSEIAFADDGIGMDYYVIRTYLSVAGKSYYSSKDFERHGIMMDPISRFGVGILSCFVSADKLIIETRKDAALEGAAIPLRITIPEVTRRFRIEQHPEWNTRPVGTTVRVHVKGSKIKKNATSDLPQRLEVTKYLRAVAGYVEFPILVSEEGKVTAILHPHQNAESLKVQHPEITDVYSLEETTSINKLVTDDSLEQASELIECRTVDLVSDLGLGGLEGRLSFFAPRVSSTGVKRTDLTPKVKHLLVYEHGMAPMEPASIVLKSPSRGAFLSRSGHKSETCQLYLDGILVSGGSSLSYHRGHFPFQASLFGWHGSDELGTPKLSVNIRSSKGQGIDVSRSHLEQSDSSLWLRMSQAFDEHRIKNDLANALMTEPTDRFFRIGSVAANGGLSRRTIVASINLAEVVGPLWTNVGSIAWDFLINRCPESLLMHPWRFDMDVNRRILRRLAFGKSLDPVFRGWGGPDFLLCPLRSTTSDVTDLVLYSVEVLELAVERFYKRTSIAFVHPPAVSNPAIAMERYARRTSDEIVADTNETESSELHRQYLKRLFRNSWDETATLIEFEQPYEQHLLYGDFYINSKLPACQELLCMLTKILEVERSESEKVEAAASVYSRLSKIRDIAPNDSQSFVGLWNHLSELCKRYCNYTPPKLQSILNPDFIFVPGTGGPLAGSWRARDISEGTSASFGSSLKS